ncbi:MAG: gliding-motility protein MglA [Planctomycetota bacterium]|nr:MAG: gliding-motility protein MglA [Planctomycetota bacterium]
MVKFNFAEKKVQCQIVYYGPPLSGKTTNLKVANQRFPKERRGELVSLETQGDRTLYFDFMPLNLGKIKGFDIMFALYTVPGQVQYNRTRKMVLQGVDGIVFVADSHIARMQSNLESLQNLEENLEEKKLTLRDIPVVFQWNKRDLRETLEVRDLEEKLNYFGFPSFEAIADKGIGVFPTLKQTVSMVLKNLKQGKARQDL